MDKWDRKLIVAITLIAMFLLFGTAFYHWGEGWSYIDAFYFSGVTLTTVGYGEFVPTHTLTKLVTVLFAFAGIGIVFYSISILAQKYFEREEERLQKIWESAKNLRAERNAQHEASRVEMINGTKKQQEKTLAALKR